MLCKRRLALVEGLSFKRRSLSTTFLLGLDSSSPPLSWHVSLLRKQCKLEWNWRAVRNCQSHCTSAWDGQWMVDWNHNRRRSYQLEHPPVGEHFRWASCWMERLFVVSKMKRDDKRVTIEQIGWLLRFFMFCDDRSVLWAHRHGKTRRKGKPKETSNFILRTVTSTKHGTVRYTLRSRSSGKSSAKIFRFSVPVSSA